MPPSLGARPTVSGYAQNQHETLRMLRNHHAHPPTHIPTTARTCMRAGGGAAQYVVDAIGERFGTTGSDLNDGLAQLYGDPWEALRFSPLSSLAYLTRLPTALPGVPHRPPHPPPRAFSTHLPGLHPPPRGSPPSSPRPSLAFPTVLPTVLHWVLLVAAPFVSSAR